MKKHRAAIDRSSLVQISDRVVFFHKKGQLNGYVFKKTSTYAYVIGDDHDEYKVPYHQMTIIPGMATLQLHSTTDAQRLKFKVSDHVSFAFKGKMLNGSIARLNPKRAHIIGDDGREYQVAYHLLTSLDENTEKHRDSQKGRLHRIAHVFGIAVRLLKKHQLDHWSFQFDYGTKRAGSCQFHLKLITLSYDFALHAKEEDIIEAILHETAHALVGKDHHHDSVWQKRAIQIGCSGKRCHDIVFMPPRYIVKCINGCWVTTCEKKRRHVVCRSCHGQVVFTTYSQDRYEKYKEGGRLLEKGSK